MNTLQQFPLILQLDVSGQPLRWMTYEDASYYECKGLVAWSIGQVEFDLHGGINVKSGKQSVLTLNTIVAIKAKKSARWTRSERVPLTNRTLFRRDWHICAYCGHEFAPGKLTRDHIKPISRRGLNIWPNVVTACGPCNKRKENRTPEEAGMTLLYLPYVPSRNEYLLLMNRNILADQMEFLLKGVPKDSRVWRYNN